MKSMFIKYYDCSKMDKRSSEQCRRSVFIRTIKFYNSFSNNVFSLINGLYDFMLQGRDSWGLAGLDLLVVDAELVYRGRPGSGVFVPPGFESGVFIHPVFLVPYVPGSSVKGVLRYVYGLVLREEDFEEKRASECVNALFGEAGDELFSGVGGVVAFDAYPLEPEVLVGDVVTPHYVDAEDEASAVPRPARLLSLREGARFRFIVGVDSEYVRVRDPGGCLRVKGRSVDPLGLVAYLVVRGLGLLGVGGKTTRGYGVFRVTGFRVVRGSFSRARTYKRV